ncbi:MAG: single-stranded DNA-binding protein, partial [Eubacterium sp.]|nr:single-stranded DNA-binding protein [Eubacterium sp.]
SGGVNFTRFSIAVNRPFTNSNGERVADYFDIIAWRQLGDRCAKYLNKGSKVGIYGSVQRRQYEDRDGIKRITFDVVADEVEFLSTKQNGDHTQTKQTAKEPENANEKNKSSADSDLFGHMEPVSPEEAAALGFGE